MLKNYPCWAVTNLSVGSRIPLAPAIYDISIIDDFQANYFSELAVEELLVQMLTVLTGNFLKVDDDIQVLNEDMLMVLSRLKINNIDLGPFIQRYKVRHNLLD